MQPGLCVEGLDAEDIRSTKQYVREIGGWLSDQDGEALYLLARQVPQGQTIVEIGSWQGKSTIWLAKGSLAGNGNSVYAIDPHCGSESHLNEGEANTEDVFHENMRKAEVDHIVVPLVRKSNEAIRTWKQDIGLLWIDGTHEYEEVKRDFQLWEPYLSSFGVVAFHDRLHPGPLQVIRQHVFKSDNFCKITICDQILAAQKTRTIET